MGKRFLKKVRETLMAQRKELVSKLDKPLTLDGVDVEGDDTDFAVGETHLILSDTLSAMDRERLISIDAALARTLNGEYGKCLECGEDINEKRLLALPFARTCIECSEHIERESKQSFTATNTDGRIRLG